MKNVFMTSDHHFGHAGILDYEGRPFRCVEEMDEALIERWNAVVGKQDKVFHLGDFSFFGKERTSGIMARLNGHKMLILGNHDRGRPIKWWLEAGFQEASEYPIVYGGFFFLSHEPMYMNKHMPYANIHGHLHGQKYEGNQYFNVSVELWEYAPVPFEVIREQAVPVEEQ